MRSLARGDDTDKVLSNLSRSLTNKLILAPTTGLKQTSAEGRDDLLGYARKLLGISEPKAPPELQEDTAKAESLEISADDTDHSRHTLQ